MTRRRGRMCCRSGRWWGIATMAAAKMPTKATGNGKATIPPHVKQSMELRSAEIAAGEVVDAPRLTTFRGIALTLPPKMPATFALDMAEIQAQDTETVDLGATYRLLVGLIGHAQWRKVRDKIGEDGDSMDDLGAVLTEIMSAITGAYDAKPGESSASATPYPATGGC